MRELSELLLSLGKTVAASGVVIKDFFVDFDHNNDGCITRAEFMRNVHRLHRRMTNASAEKLASAYAVPQGVHFRALQADVEALGAGHVMSFNIGTSTAAEVSRAKSISGALKAKAEDFRSWSDDRDREIAHLERKLALQVSERRIRLAEFFLDFDPLRHGTCPEPKFVQGLRRTFTTKLSGGRRGVGGEVPRGAERRELARVRRRDRRSCGPLRRAKEAAASSGPRRPSRRASRPSSSASGQDPAARLQSRPSRTTRRNEPSRATSSSVPAVRRA